MTSGKHQPHESGDDPLDMLIRQTVQHNTPSVQPPKRIWDRIQGQVTAGPAPTSHHPPAERLSRLFAPFVQGIAAAAVLILMGISLVSTREVGIRTFEALDPLATPATVSASALLVRPASVQRQDASAIVDDALDYTSGRDSVQKDAPQVERSPRLRMVDDPDIDLVPDSYYALVVNRP